VRPNSSGKRDQRGWQSRSVRSRPQQATCSDKRALRDLQTASSPLHESGCLGMQPKAFTTSLLFKGAISWISGAFRGGELHPRLNIGRKTDSEQVPWGKDEKNFEKRVKQCLKLLRGNRFGLQTDQPWSKTPRKMILLINVLSRLFGCVLVMGRLVAVLSS